MYVIMYALTLWHTVHYRRKGIPSGKERCCISYCRYAVHIQRRQEKEKSFQMEYRDGTIKRVP